MCSCLYVHVYTYVRPIPAWGMCFLNTSIFFLIIHNIIIIVYVNDVCSVIYSEEYDLRGAAFTIVRGGVISGDLATVEMLNGPKRYMTLLSSWGYVADIDIESEKLRSIGETRFVLGALKSILQMRVYNGRLHYLPLEEEEEEEEGEALKEERKEDVGDGENREEQGSASMIPLQISGNHPDESCQERTGSEQPRNGDPVREHWQEQSELATDLLPPLSDPVPSNWKTIEGNFTGVTVLMAPFIAHGFMGDPNLTLGSGKLHINYSLDDMTRTGLMSILLSANTGSYLQRDDVHSVKSQAYRLEPLTSTGVITVDGEVIDYVPHQVQLHPQLIRIMSRRRKRGRSVDGEQK